MYGKVKLTKKQIKEDKFTTFMLSAKQQFSDSWQYYVIGFVIVVLIISAIVFYIDMQEKQSLESANIYAKSVVDYRQKNYQNALLSLQLILDDHASTESAEPATYLLGKINLDMQNYPEATRNFELFISKYSKNKFKTAASYAGVATALENQGQFKEAAEKFVKAISIDTVGPMAPNCNLSALRNFLVVGDVPSAEVHYDYLTDKYAGTTLATRAELLFAEKSKQ